MTAKNTWVLDQIKVDVSGFFTTHHYFETEVGMFGEFTFPAFSQHGTFRTADGRELLMQKKSWLGSAHECIEGERVRGVADRRGWLSRDMIVQFDGQKYTLVPEGLLKQGWFLLDAGGNTLIEIQPRGFFRQGVYLTVRGAIGADLVAFAYYLVHMRQQEDAAAAAAS